MKNFAKSILNYYAAFNETRFRFTTKSTHKWSNNDLSLDFSVFPELQQQLLSLLQNQNQISLTIKPGDYSISLDRDEFRRRLQELAQSHCSQESISELRNELGSDLEEGVALDNYTVYRAWNLRFRKQLGELLLQLQEEKKQELIAEYDIEHLPLSTLNATSIEQELFDTIKHLTSVSANDSEFISSALEKIAAYSPKLVMYELYSLLLSFHQLTASGTAYLFIHQFTHQENSYPLLSIEVALDTAGSNKEISIHAARDLVQINTAAINSAKMGKVLTTPRACAIKDMAKYVLALEMYFQAYYQKTESFIFSPSFKKIVGKNLPTITPRIGLQIMEKEDRTLLDYSELITSIDSGSGKKFVDIVTDYVEGAIEHQTTYEEVHREYSAEYPPKSAKNFLSDIPLTLNGNQRKILTAAKNPKNRVMRVDGPPGTGKSYTITALVYLANLLNKTVIITSHKPQALDVVEEKLVKQFRDVHPYAKPPILRLTKLDTKTLNSVDNTLSDTVINQTLNRTTQVNSSLITEDLQSLAERFETTMSESWDAGSNQYIQLEHIEKLLQIAQELGVELVLRQFMPVPSRADLKSLIAELDTQQSQLSLSQLEFIIAHKNSLNEWQKIAKDLNEVGHSSVTQNSDELENLSLLQVIEKLDAVLKDGVSINQLNLDDIKKIPHLSATSSNHTPTQLTQALELVKQLNKISKQITVKLFGNEEKRRLEHRLHNDFPQLEEQIKKSSLETVMFDLERDVEQIQKTKTELPWIKESYIVYRAPAPESIAKLLSSLNHPDNATTVTLLTTKLNENLQESSCADLRDALIEVTHTTRRQDALTTLHPLIETFQLQEADYASLSQKLDDLQRISSAINEGLEQSVGNLYHTYPELFDSLGVTSDNIKTLKNLLQANEQTNLFWQFVDVHSQLQHSKLLSLQTDLLQKYQEKQLRLLVHKNEQRFAQLAKHPNDVQKILKAIQSNQRITTEQANVLFTHVPCIIAPPDLISQHFPMNADLFDWLIIDEASQVSIAESLSLLLRSKQTFVFGDELQYGAVGATNVSSEYSREYFRHVLEDYGRDKNEVIDQTTIDQIADEVSQPVTEDEVTSSNTPFIIDTNTKEWIKTFGIRTSTLDFAKAIRNYSDSLTVHFRSYPEIISYSNEFFYKPSEINLVTSRIRTKPISQVLEFIKVDCKGFAGANINLDEIEVIRARLAQLHAEGFTGSIGIICSFREQTDRMKEILRKDLPCLSDLVHDNDLKIWFVGDVQGEERDIVFYSFVEDTKTGNANLSTIYPVVDGVADSIRNLRMQRLNVGFSRAKDMMVFVHSMDLKEYKSTRLGDALDYYWKVLNSTTDNFITDTSVFGSPREEYLYSLITQADFFKTYQDRIRLIAQFEIGKYLKEEYRRFIPNYRVDFLLTLTTGHKEHSLIIEYDGLEFHTQSPHQVRSATDFDREYIDYDIQRQLELESYGYKFLRFNKFTLTPQKTSQTEVDIVNDLLFQKMADAVQALSSYSYTQAKPLVLKEDAAMYSTRSRSPMEVKLEDLIKQTEFYQQHQTQLELLANYSIKDDGDVTFPAYVPNYEVDFLLKINQADKTHRIVIEYDGVKYHSDKPDQIETTSDMDNALTDADDRRQADLEELGYTVIRINKFTLYDQSSDLEPVERVNRILTETVAKLEERKSDE